MSYFFSRLVVFVVVTSVVYVVGPSFVASRFAPSHWLFTFSFMCVVFSGVFTLIFFASNFFRRAIFNRWNIESLPAKDALIAACFFLACLVFLFAPRPGSFSFGDNIGLIFQHGYLTDHGLYVQLKGMRLNILAMLLFWGACRLGVVNTSFNQGQKEE